LGELSFAQSLTVRRFVVWHATKKQIFAAQKIFSTLVQTLIKRLRNRLGWIRQYTAWVALAWYRAGSGLAFSSMALLVGSVLPSKLASFTVACVPAAWLKASESTLACLSSDRAALLSPAGSRALALWRIG
jgi:hypothetical protein